MKEEQWFQPLMNARPDFKAHIGVGLYTLPEAAKLLGEAPRTIRRWMEGYEYNQNDERHRVAPLWTADLPAPEGGVEISFRDLIELRFVRAFLDLGLGLRTIRSCIEVARDCVNSDRPFSSGQFRTDGKTIFLESLAEVEDLRLLDLKKKQYVFKNVVDRTFKDLDLEDDVVTRWRPYRGKQSIVLDPRRSFGQPLAEAYGVPTVVLAEAAKAEGSVARVAAMYEVDSSVVKDAVRYHEELDAA